MNRRDIAFLPNRPDLMGELRAEFKITHGAWMLEAPCGDPTMDAPESIARGSAIGFVSETGWVITQGHVSRPGWRPRGVPGSRSETQRAQPLVRG